MPWEETEPVNERLKFIAECQSGLYSFAELCVRYGVSRKTGYKWWSRYEEEGIDGLKDRSRAPLTCPHQMSERAAEAIVEAKTQHPSWGPKKLLPYIKKKNPTLRLPSVSAAGNLLAREGLVLKRRRRRKWKHPGRPTTGPTKANDFWAADFKGHFHTRDGHYCYPLTVTDLHSRYLLGCEALLNTKGAGVKLVFTRLFKEFGLPKTIRTDNGTPFASLGIHGLSQVNVWWMKLGIVHQRIEPGRPDQNGSHERMHRTLKAETTLPPALNAERQQLRFNRFCEEFNCQRPHEALSQETPSERWKPSPRTYPDRPPAPEYPGHFHVRLVSKAGTLRFKNKQLFLSQALQSENVGFEETDDGIWSVFFYNTLLGKLDESDWRFHA